MPSNGQKSVELAEEIGAKVVSLVRERQYDELMSYCLTLAHGLVSAENEIAELKEQLAALTAEPGEEETDDTEEADTEVMEMFPAADTEEPDTAEEPEEPQEPDLSQDFVYRSGPDVLARCKARQDAIARPSSYIPVRGRDRHIPAWKRRGDRP